VEISSSKREIIFDDTFADKIKITVTNEPKEPQNSSIFKHFFENNVLNRLGPFRLMLLHVIELIHYSGGYNTEVSHAGAQG
jgi:hypothetical protein